VDIRKIKKLIELLEESALTELEISEGEESIRLSRQSLHHSPASSGGIPIDTPSENIGSPKETLSAAENNDPELDDDPESIETASVVSPMVGTFYASPNPDSSPYVGVGSQVSAGDTLCVIEAMKIFNHVETEHAGIVHKIMKNSGDPVEFGEVLFLIETTTAESIN